MSVWFVLLSCVLAGTAWLWWAGRRSSSSTRRIFHNAAYGVSISLRSYDLWHQAVHRGPRIAGPAIPARRSPAAATRWLRCRGLSLPVCSC